ncbi:Metallo-dependent phosphatase-like protein [Halteromyces radiatus]|uniref:Metallo-dependent phosphatase-like protein n=1 Tax=Halteromyces radiatus TaxID=101107 RepID=UPI0022202E5E|nr:Metallo-dependent phosphatase-like protein [Halteromyces radiatus]KAI8093008.1 Metallo-dependent phosphatase-like protein [Halteromyces radiatus]
MKSKIVGWTCLVITFLCSLRACHLYWSSTKEFRSVQGPLWPFRYNKINKTDFEQSFSLSTTQSFINQSHIMDDKPDNLFYFTQISDLHISKYRAKGHTLHFLQFIQSVLPIIRPEFVVVTGDLTDAKDHRRITSQQYIEEWKTYKMAIDQQPWTNTTWYDMRGNHDCFDLPSWQSRMNLYRTYGQSADRVEHGKGIYTWQHSPSFGDYQFVAIDACPKRGPSRPFNFFGYLTSNTMDRLAHALSKPSNHTFVFSHYPTTTMIYFFFFFLGLGDVLQSYDPMTKTLELELGDMKDHGMYRIVAVDHDIISFVDARLPMVPSTQTKRSSLIPLTASDKVEWPGKLPMAPVILITNPKDARFILDNKEPLSRIQSSSHIRFLVFTDQTPDQLSFLILVDGQPVIGSNDDHAPHYMGNDQHPLWTLPWNPMAYQNGTHILSIQVNTTHGLVGESKVIFRTDGRRIKIGGGAGEWIISTHMSTVVSLYLNIFQCFLYIYLFFFFIFILVTMYYSIVNCNYADIIIDSPILS